MSDAPRVLGQRYEVGDLIGRGGMAQVHLGYDTRLSRTVAIKILRTDLAQDPMFLARFRREAQSAAALNHPSIVSVYDTGEEQVVTAIGKEISLPYIVMEYVKGRTVAALLADGNPVPIAEAVQITVGVLSALQYSHHEGIIHRDIKPGNVMLTPDAKIKVMDFGIARAIADSAATMTQTNSVVGTAQYLSPEQARGEVVDARSDLYSTGCLLYELLTGQPPFTGDSAVAVAYQHVSETPRPASLIAPDIPDSIDRVVMKSLAKRRDERYQSAAEFREDLLSAARGEGVEAPSVTSWNLKPVAAAAYAPTQVATAVNGVSAASPTGVENGSPTGTLTGTQTGVQPAVDEKTKRRNKIMIWLGVLLLALAAAGVVYALMSGDGKNDPNPSSSSSVATTVVPDLEGLTKDEVQKALEDEGLVMRQLVSQASADVPKDTFLSSDPEPGTSIEAGGTVRVTFSAGPEMATVPDITGMTTEEAAKLLAENNLRLGGSTSQDDSTQPAGTILSSDPEAGAEAEPNSFVSVTVSSGKISVPDVRGMSQTDATSTLVSAGLTVSSRVIEQESNDPAGTVIGTSPGTGATVSIGDEITLTVAQAHTTPTPTPTSTSPTPSQTENPSTDEGDGG